MQKFKKTRIVTRISGLSMAANSVLKVQFRGITLVETTPSSIDSTNKWSWWGRKRNYDFHFYYQGGWYVADGLRHLQRKLMPFMPRSAFRNNTESTHTNNCFTTFSVVFFLGRCLDCYLYSFMAFYKRE